jgi:ATP-dependent RNA helicase HelY
MVEYLAAEDLLPAIYFVFSRAGCDEAAMNLLDSGVRLTVPEERRQIRAIAEERTATLSDGDLDVLGYDRWLAALELGIAAHHAGMVPPFKEAVEACFVRGLVKCVFATETLALGINMPARSVVIEQLSKFTGDHHELLTPAEYTQLTGRAGRRGIDTEGHAFVCWSPFVPFDQVAGLALSRRFALTSSFRPTYNMTANLVRRYDPDDAHRLLNRSFAQFQSNRSVVSLESRRDARRKLLEQYRAASTCERGSVDEYRALLRADDQARRGASDRRAVDLALLKVRPGDVIVRDGERLAVLSVAHRGPNRMRVHAIGTKGRSFSIDSRDFTEPPVRVGEVAMPVPFNPNNRSFQQEVVRQLRRLPTGRSGPGRRRPRVEAKAPDHPVASCPDRATHVRAAVQVERIGRELADLDRRIGSSAGSVARRFDAVLGLLEGWGFVRDWSLTDRGELLVRTYHESDLLLAEAVARGLFDDLDPPAVAALASCVTYEHRSRIPPPPPWFPSPDVRARFEQLERIGRDLQAAERAADLPETRLPDPTFAGLAHAWASGTDLATVLDDEDLSGGDFVRNVRQLIDLLRQLAGSAPQGATRRAADAAADGLFRGVVAASSLIGSGVDDDEPLSPDD